LYSGEKVDDSSILADSSNRSSTIQSKTTLPPKMVSAKRKLQLLKSREAKQNLKHEAKNYQNSGMVFDISSSFGSYGSDSANVTGCNGGLF
jgi:hypothetical protein